MPGSRSYGGEPVEGLRFGSDHDDPDEERAGRHAAMLCEPAEIGLELARGLRGQPLHPAETAMAFSRLARASA